MDEAVVADLPGPVRDDSRDRPRLAVVEDLEREQPVGEVVERPGQPDWTP